MNWDHWIAWCEFVRGEMYREECTNFSFERLFLGRQPNIPCTHGAM
jgi:hypothetical protein